VVDGGRVLSMIEKRWNDTVTFRTDDKHLKEENEILRTRRRRHHQRS
jgi:hypothetical protein